MTKSSRHAIAGLIAVAGYALPAIAQNITITQSIAPTTVTPGSIACAAGGGTVAFAQVTTDNQYWRSFNLSAEPLVLAGGMNVTSVQFGYEQATLPPGTQTVSVDLYKDTDGGAPTSIGTDLVNVGSGTVEVANGTLQFAVCNVAATFAKTDTLVVRISTPNYIPTYAPPPNGTNTNPMGQNAVFFIGSNNQGQTAPGYLSTTGCGVPNPLPLTAIGPPGGFPNMHMVFNVNGTTSGGGGGGCYANCDNTTIPPCLNVNDFTCFLNQYGANNVAYANCDASTIPPVLNVNDFTCFLNAYGASCPNPCDAHP